MLNIGDLLVESFDYLLIVDKEYTIVYSSRFDTTFNSQSESTVIGKNFFDIYNVEGSESTIKKCMETKDTVISKYQSFKDNTGKSYITNNITIPLIIRDELRGVIELSIDVSREMVIHDRFDKIVDNITMDSSSITFDNIISKDRTMMEAIEKANFLSKLPNHILLYGETGTGKELFAQSIINASGVSRKKVVIQNCAAVPNNLIESILFGTVKGAYTGAENTKGLFEEADSGIIFLDELNSIPYEVQGKLLRVIQEGTFRSLGSSVDKKVNVKIIAAINVEPNKAIEDGVLRKDLFYRFSNGLISLPPLRERKSDISLYMDYFLRFYSDLYSKEYVGMDTDVKDFFYTYPWEGNVREIKNVIESMIIMLKSGENISMKLLPTYMLKLKKQVIDELKEDIAMEDGKIPYKEVMESTERRLILEALNNAKGNKTKAAEMLGIPRKTLDYRMDKLKCQ